MFFCSCILLVALMVALHIFVILIHKGSTSRHPPLWVKRLFFPTKYWGDNAGHPSPDIPSGQNTCRDYEPSQGFSDKSPMVPTGGEPLSIWALDTKGPHLEVSRSSDPVMQGISENLQAIRIQLRGSKAKELIAKDWRNLAEKIDKILFTVVMVATLFMCVFCTIGPQFDLI